MVLSKVLVGESWVVWVCIQSSQLALIGVCLVARVGLLRVDGTHVWWFGMFGNSCGGDIWIVHADSCKL